MSTRTLAWIFALGLLVRAVLLPLPGTIDVQTQKLWSFGAATDVSGIYGVGGTPPERKLVHWLDLYGPVDYPPLALLELAVVGRIYRAIDPQYADSPLLTILVKTPGLIAEIAFVAALLTWGRRLFGSAAQWAAIAWWLNPAVWFSGAALGYVDAQGAVPAALAVLAATSGRPALAGALIAIAAGTKPQTIYVLPVIAAALLRSGDKRLNWAPIARAAVAGAVTTAVVVAPFVLRGATENMVQGVSRLLQHNMLSGTAPNVGWILTWLLRVWYAAPDMGWAGALGLEIRILQITRVVELGYADPRPIATIVTLAAAGAAAWRTVRGARHAATAALAGWTIYAYSVLGIAVHENHFYPAVPLFAIASAGLLPLRAIYWVTSLIFALNLYLFYGLSRGWPPLIHRTWTYVDLTVLLAVVNVVVFVWTTVRVWRSGGSPPTVAEQPRDRLQGLDVIRD